MRISIWYIWLDVATNHIMVIKWAYTVFYRTLIPSLSKVVMIKTSNISDFKIHFGFGYTYYCTFSRKGYSILKTCNIESKEPFQVALNYEKLEFTTTKVWFD